LNEQGATSFGAKQLGHTFLDPKPLATADLARRLDPLGPSRIIRVHDPIAMSTVRRAPTTCPFPTSR
jgi:hypothetical protein